MLALPLVCLFMCVVPLLSGLFSDGILPDYSLNDRLFDSLSDGPSFDVLNKTRFDNNEFLREYNSLLNALKVKNSDSDPISSNNILLEDSAPLKVPVEGPLINAMRRNLNMKRKEKKEPKPQVDVNDKSDCETKPQVDSIVKSKNNFTYQYVLNPIYPPQAPMVIQPMVVQARAVYEPVIHDHPPIHKIERMMRKKKEKTYGSSSEDSDQTTSSDSSDSSDSKDTDTSIESY